MSASKLTFDEVHLNVCRDRRISHEAFRLFMVLLDASNGQSEFTPPTIERASRCGLKPDEVLRCSAELAAAGWLEFRPVSRRKMLWALLDGCGHDVPRGWM